MGISQLIVGQDNKNAKYPLSPADTYVLQVRLIGPVYKNDCPCGYRKNMTCFMFRIKEAKVLYCAANTPLDAADLTGINYVVVPYNRLDSIMVDKEIVMTATLSSSSKYLLLEVAGTQPLFCQLCFFP